tara:strand:- start:27 stop:596 length:570 start_codon:yes stop_codon:yes gene_type:complete
MLMVLPIVGTRGPYRRISTNLSRLIHREASQIRACTRLHLASRGRGGLVIDLGSTSADDSILDLDVMVVVGNLEDLLAEALRTELLLLLEGPRHAELLHAFVIVTDVLHLARALAVLEEARDVPGGGLERGIVELLLIGHTTHEVTGALKGIGLGRHRTSLDGRGELEVVERQSGLKTKAGRNLAQRTV